jgi:hypothetical protein
MKFFRTRFLFLLSIGLLLASCQSPQVSQGNITVSIKADGQTQQLDLPAGSTVGDALTAADITTGNLDKITPPLYAILSDGDAIQIARVREEFETEDVVIPFEHQVVRNESLPEGEIRLVQPGSNGKQEITYRRVYEDGVETTKSVVKTVILQDAVPEIMMVGVQAAFAPLQIPGKLAYLAGGNAWLMEGSTSNRKPLVTTGDLDGRIFTLSPDGSLLLFTRKSKKPADQEINTLWVVSTDGKAAPISLGVANVVHFAAWVPSARFSVAYSTVEPRAQAPGWQANNNLFVMRVGLGGTPFKPRELIETNFGGAYGWWGTTFAYSPGGSLLAYIRPDGIGLVNLEDGSLQPLLDITPLQTRSDWAWLPGLSWGADGRTLYFVTHAPPPSLVNPEDSPYFDLSAASLASAATVDLAQQTGMFAYPSASREQDIEAEKSYRVAFLQAIFPAQSETSRYRVVVMDRDGSNRQVVFPPKDSPGLDPQTPAWAPQAVQGQMGDFLALVYQGNLWLVDTGNAQSWQITGDGLISRIDWK